MAESGVELDSRYLQDFPGLLQDMIAQGKIASYVRFDANTDSVNAAITLCAATPVAADGSVTVAVGEAATLQLLQVCFLFKNFLCFQQ